MAPIEKENPVMRTASVIARYLAGLIFLVMGLNGFLNFIPFPPPGGIAGQFMVPCMPRITCGWSSHFRSSQVYFC